MKQEFDFDKLFIFDMANNHMGDLEHGLRIIRETAKACKKFDFKFGFKLQYRNLDSFIHPDFKGRKDTKYVKRFEETRLSEDKFKILKVEIESLGFISICTPFDEQSVDLIEKQNFNIIKVGSCSFNDWLLLERIVKTEKPIILSVGGVSLEDIDKVVVFFEHREKVFCLMHCVSEYPTVDENLQLNQIDFIRNRYPNVAVGYSAHENPDNIIAIKSAIAKGASVFEKHVGVETKNYKLNQYSLNPAQIEKWLLSAQEEFKICGFSREQRYISEKEIENLVGLKRGVFANKNIAAGERVNTSNIFLAIPSVEGQLLASDLSKYAEFVAKKEIDKNKPVIFKDVQASNLRGRVTEIINKLRDIIIEGKVSLPDKVEFELSHHYGIDKFQNWGAAIINCINREYCKKIIIMLPGQRHPHHYHKKKEETFHILYGDMTLNLNGVENQYKPGDMIIIERGAGHSFSSENGVVFEEISTTHFAEDSYYEDEKIIENKDRKTEMTFWSDWLTKPLT